LFDQLKLTAKNKSRSGEYAGNLIKLFVWRYK